MGPRLGATRALALALVVLGGCRAPTGADPTEPDSTESRACPRPASLDDPSRRVDAPLPEHAFTSCDFQVYGPTEIVDPAEYARVVECADPPGRPAIDFATTRLFVTRVRAPSVLLGATREADGRILVHVHAPGMCSGVDWGDVVHVVALPDDGSPIEVVACVEGSTCGPGELPP